MMKKAIVVVMVLVGLIAFAGCTTSTEANKATPTQAPVASFDKEISEQAYNNLLDLTVRIAEQVKEGNMTDELIAEMMDAGLSDEVIEGLKDSISKPVSLYDDGTYRGIGKAHNGDIEVEVTVRAGVILFIAVIDHKETAPDLLEVFNEIPKAILQGQSTEGVDAISGASEASEGYILAVNDALEKAKK